MKRLNLFFLHIARNLPTFMAWDNWNHHWCNKRMQRKYRELYMSMREDISNPIYLGIGHSKEQHKPPF